MSFDPSKRYTIRMCIAELRRIGKNCVELRNGTKIIIHEANADPNTSACFGTFKGEERIMRNIFCKIIPSKHTIMIDELNQYSLFDQQEFNRQGYSYFTEGEYLLPERIMNLFIFANRGIEHYMTIGAWACILADMYDPSRF